MRDVSDFFFRRGKVVVTCGPGYEPIDAVRRLTNHSTGRLGTELSRALKLKGYDVVCLKGTLSSWNENLPGCELRSYTTANHLLKELQKLAQQEKVGAIFHAAALSDFRVKQISDAAGRPLAGKKISSRLGEVHLILEAAPKIIGSLRTLFPEALLVGWKYEVEGNREDVVQAGVRQMEENRTDACVLNGTAYGKGFGICEKAGALTHCVNDEELFAYWTGRLDRQKD